MKRWILTILALCLLCGAACAETEYEVLPADVNMDVLLTVAFGDKADQAVLENRENGGVFYDLPNSDGAPFCGAQHDTTIQTRVSIYTQAFADAAHEPSLYDNVVPSGIAACKLTREEAVAQTEALAATLCLGEHTLQCVTAYGQLGFATPEYKVSLLQTWNGKPVYWSASSQNVGVNEISMLSNRVSFVWDDTGLVEVDGNWCRFVPTGDDRPLIDETTAVNALVALGESPAQLESCYLMQFDGQSATATPAYRYQNRFVNAFTGEVMQ